MEKQNDISPEAKHNIMFSVGIPFSFLVSPVFRMVKQTSVHAAEHLPFAKAGSILRKRGRPGGVAERMDISNG